MSQLFLRKCRKRKGLTQPEVAALLGVHETTYRRWELGDGEPKASQVVRLCEVFDVSEQELRYGVLEMGCQGEVMDLREHGNQTFCIYVWPEKIKLRILWDVESEAQLDDLLAEVRTKVLAVMEFKKKVQW